MTDTIESRTAALLHDLCKQKDQVEQECKRKLQILDAKIDAVQMTAQLLRERSESPSTPSQVDTLEIPKGLRSMTQHGALEALARANGMRVRITEAIPILRRYGLMKSKKNAWNIVYSVMKRKGNWTNVGKGEYELIENPAQQSFNGSGATSKTSSDFKVEVGDSLRDS
jgi:hypothetical protein